MALKPVNIPDPGTSGKTSSRIECLQLALVRLVEIVGEAAPRVSDEGRDCCSCVSWRQVRVMRNRLIHGCDTIEWDLPPLIAELRRILGEEPDRS